MDEQRLKQLKKEADRWRLHSETDRSYRVFGYFASECLSDALGEIYRLRELLKVKD